MRAELGWLLQWRRDPGLATRENMRRPKPAEDKRTAHAAKLQARIAQEPAGPVGEELVWRGGVADGTAPQHAVPKGEQKKVVVGQPGKGGLELTLLGVAASPATTLVEGFVTAEEGAAMIATGDEMGLTRSMTGATGVDEKAEAASERTSESAEGYQQRLDIPTVRVLLQRAAQLLQVGVLLPAHPPTTYLVTHTCQHTRRQPIS